MKGCHKWIILSLAALSACTSDVDKELEVQFPVGFTATTDMDAREVSTLTNMGVYAYYTGSSSWEDYANTTPAPNFMSNQKIENNSGKWTYSPIKHWPNTAGDKISFFAYAPCDATLAGNEPQIAFVGGSSFTCTLPVTNPTTDPNLFLASLIDQTKSTSNLTFNFEYALTKVSFKVENKIDTEITVNSLQIKAPRTGTFHFGGENNGYTCETTSDDLLSYSVTPSMSPVVESGTTLDIGTFYLLPDNTSVTCILTYNDNNSRSFSLSNSNTKQWTSGGSITYTLILQ